MKSMATSAANIDFTRLTDSDLTALQRDAGLEASRRAAIASLPDAISSMVAEYRNAGGDMAALKAKINAALQ